MQYKEPPQALSCDLELGTSDWANRDFYHVVSALVIPRPIGWISTLSSSGRRNLAPYSFFNLMGTDPFYVAFGSTHVKDTVANLREVPEFVVNIVSMDMLQAMNFTSTDFPRDEDEFEWSSLSALPSTRVRPPRVGECKAHLECEVAQIITEINTHIVLGRILHAHVDQRVWENGRVDPRKLDPVLRLSGSAYATLGEIVNVTRASWADVENQRARPAMPRVKR